MFMRIMNSSLFIFNSKLIMKPFLLRLILFFSIIIGVNFVLNQVIVVPGDDRYNLRYTYLTQNIKNYNTLFFGSSRTLRHLIPSVFDSANRVKGVDTHSFNLGTPANQSLETYEQYESFLNDYTDVKHHNIKYAFVEIHPLLALSKKNMTTRKGFYWVSWDNLNFIFTYFKVTKPYFHSRMEIYYNYFVAFILKTFGFNYLNIEDNKKVEEIYSGLKKDGYISLQDEIRSVERSERKRELIEMQMDFRKDTIALNKRALKVMKHFEKEGSINDIVTVHKNKLQHLYVNSAALGIKLVFVIQPRLSDYREVLALKKALPENVVLDIANPAVYPNLWAVENSFDVGHMTENGAVFFTNELSRKVCNQN